MIISISEANSHVDLSIVNNQIIKFRGLTLRFSMNRRSLVAGFRHDFDKGTFIKINHMAWKEVNDDRYPGPLSGYSVSWEPSAAMKTPVNA